MATEIELKAWISNPDEISSRINSLAAYMGTFEKNDSYFVLAASDNKAPAAAQKKPEYGIRIRNEKTVDPEGISRETCYVTWKHKEIHDRVEVNNENEFEVSSGQTFIELIKHLGLVELIRKRKTGRSYKYNDITAELAEVDGLGWFIEIEILMQENEKINVEFQRNRLLLFLEKLNIPKESIESRSYTQMLLANNAGP